MSTGNAIGVGAAGSEPLEYAIILANGYNGNTELTTISTTGNGNGGTLHAHDLRGTGARIPLGANAWTGELYTDIRTNGPTLGPNKVTITKAGRYHISAAASIAGPSAGYLLQIVKNEATVIGSTSGYGAAGARIPTDAEWIGDLVVGDTIDIRGDSETLGTCSVDSIKLIIQQLPTATVVTGDMPATDNAASGYFDIGTMRVQWLRGNYGNGTNAVLPAPFANTNYVVTIGSGSQNTFGSVTTKTTTGFTVVGSIASAGLPGGPFPMEMIAIGLKP